MSLQAQEQINPFWSPSDTTLYYGSGDVDSSGLVDSDDLIAMQGGVQNDMSDVDGDGIASSADDQLLLSNYLDGEISFLPSHWNMLETIDPRDDWLEKMLEIDQTDTITYRPGFTSWRIAKHCSTNFHGLENPNDPNMPDFFDMSLNRRFNMPLYYVQIVPFTPGDGHGMNAILTGDEALEWASWCFVEPQFDGIYMQPGGASIQLNSRVGIYRIEGFNPGGGAALIPLLAFDIDDVGSPSLFYQNPDLMIERPSVHISSNPTKIPDTIILSQNYPNPFNPSTTISYDLPEASAVRLTVYDVRGQEIIALQEAVQSPGNYKVEWRGIDQSGNPVSTGVYFCRLQAGDFNKTIKMVYLR